jgi:acyl-coenzyme A synthetase/AMP-(fatty) acid ligase
MAVPLLSLVALTAAYVLFLAWRLGLHQRLPLALGRISLEAIPDRAARRHRDKPLFTTDEPCGWTVPALSRRYPDPKVWSAERIKATAGFVARMLTSRLGVRSGDRVAVLKTNHLDVQVLIAAVVRANAIACPINGKFASTDLRAYLQNIGAKILISDAATMHRLSLEGADLGPVERLVVAGHRPAPNPFGADETTALLEGSYPEVEVVWIEEALDGIDSGSTAVPRSSSDPLYLVHSSGTTGFPKAVTLRNGPQSHAVRGWLSYVHLSRTMDRGYLAVPTNHQAVILTFNSLLLLGMRTHWTGPYDREGFDPVRVVRELKAGRFTGFFGFPVTYTQLKEVDLEAAGLRHMRFWASTADATHEAVTRRFVAVGGAFKSVGLPISGSVFLDAQGSSEVGTPSVLRYVTRFTRQFARRIGRAGSTPFGPEIRIADGSGRVVSRGSVGRLEVRGRTVFDSYWNDPALTARAIRDGWFFTGDVARLEPDGNFVQLDREVDVIRTRAGDVYSLPIEEILHFHPAVFDVCVYGARQPDGTQLPAACVALRNGHTVESASLLGELNERLPPESRLCRLDVRPWAGFPMGVTGKTLKRVFARATEAMHT